MYIKYTGFVVGVRSRIYKFSVTAAPQEARDFTVEIQSESFRSALKFQDGPEICFRRLAHDLEAETPTLPVTAHLEIGDEEIQEYVSKKGPRKSGGLSDPQHSKSARQKGA